MSQNPVVRIEIINTGTELLLGNTLNTHGAWFGRELFKLGLRISRQTTVPDGDAIHDSLQEAIGRADAVIVTGGLGPTSDDITREITAEVLGLELITDEAAMRSASRRSARWARIFCRIPMARHRGSTCRPGSMVRRIARFSCYPARRGNSIRCITPRWCRG